MPESAREFLSRSVGVPISEQVDMTLLARELTRLTMDDRHEQLRASQEAKNAAALQRHAALAAQLTGALRTVLDHHAPHPAHVGGYSTRDPFCTGCDGKQYDDEPVDWPCTTWELIERATAAVPDA